MCRAAQAVQRSFAACRPGSFRKTIQLMANPKIPEELKAELPRTTFGKILGTTPIVLTVVATLLAGLASSEMTRAQYERSLAAQQQAKAGDQWGYFQAKRMRSAMQANTLDILKTTADLQGLAAAALSEGLASTPAAAAAASPAARQAFSAVDAGALLPPNAGAPLEPAVKAALDAIHGGASEAEVANLVWAVNDETLTRAVRGAQSHAADFEHSTKPLIEALDSIEKQLAGSPRRRDFALTRMGFHALRYDSEARLNQVIGSLIELQVKKSNLKAERHHRRSGRFFFGMLAAQMGVILSTLAMAASRRNLLWGIAAAAGTVAIAFAVYVYVYV